MEAALRTYWCSSVCRAACVNCGGLHSIDILRCQVMSPTCNMAHGQHKSRAAAVLRQHQHFNLTSHSAVRHITIRRLDNVVSHHPSSKQPSMARCFTDAACTVIVVVATLIFITVLLTCIVSCPLITTGADSSCGNIAFPTNSSLGHSPLPPFSLSLPAPIYKHHHPSVSRCYHLRNTQKQTLVV